MLSEIAYSNYNYSQPILAKIALLLQKNQNLFEQKRVMPPPIKGLPEVLVLGLDPTKILFSNTEPSRVVAFCDFKNVCLGSPAQDVQKLIGVATNKWWHQQNGT